MIKAVYSEMDGPAGVTRRLSVQGHAGYAPAGQDIVCAGASILVQALVWMAADAGQADCTASDGPEGPRVTVTAGPAAELRQGERMAGGFELARAGLALLAERYPDHLRFSDTSRQSEEGMVDLQLFAEKKRGAARREEPPALSRAQARQARAEGTLHPKGQADRRRAAEREEEEVAAKTPRDAAARQPVRPAPEQMLGIGEAGRFIRGLHLWWALEEAEMRRGDPTFSFRQALQSPEMRRMMKMPGMRMRDAYRASHYDRLMAGAARAVERGVVDRVRQRGARPAENGIHATGAAAVAPDVSRMTRAQREALEREALHGAKIRL